MFEGMEHIEFEHEGTPLRGYATKPSGGTEPSPAVLVMHSALGIAHNVNEPIARKLAERGYVAICTDMYGAHLAGASVGDAGRAYAENLADPEKQRARTVAWFDRIAARPDVDDERIAAVGFCYGGMTVLELARSGAGLRAAVSYHGILTTHAPAEPGTIPGHVVAYCGAGDPYAPVEAGFEQAKTNLYAAGYQAAYDAWLAANPGDTAGADAAGQGGGQSSVAQNYHQTVEPFCQAAVRGYFSSF